MFEKMKCSKSALERQEDREGILREMRVENGIITTRMFDFEDIGHITERFVLYALNT